MKILAGLAAFAALAAPSAGAKSMTEPAKMEAAVHAYVAAFEAGGMTKLILRPQARGDEDTLAQTRRLIEEVRDELEEVEPGRGKKA